MSSEVPDFFCCKDFKRLIKDDESRLKYNKYFRSVSIDRYLANFCLFCSQPFPPELNDFHYFILEEEFGIPSEDYYEFEEQGKVPKEFFSDEWWKKRINHPKFPTRKPTPEEEIKANIDERDWLSQEQKAEELEKELSNYAEDLKNLDWFCCVNLKFILTQDTTCPLYPYKKGCNDYPVIYEPEKRRFKLINIDNKTLLHRGREKGNQTFRKLHFFIQFCPKCGSKLPKSLAKEWFEIVREKFGITDLSDYKAISKLPKKYLTEEWWREAGL